MTSPYISSTLEITPDSMLQLRHCSAGRGGPAVLLVHGLGMRAGIFAANPGAV